MTRFYDVTVILHSGHQIQINEWEGYIPQNLADVMSNGDGVFSLNHESRVQNIVRVEEIAAVHAKPSTGFRVVVRDDQDRWWMCMSCDRIVGRAEPEYPGIAALAVTVGHRCGGDHA